MAPLPKRKHSTQRKGKRLRSRAKGMPNLIKCKNCGSMKLSHLPCKNCGK